MLPWEHLLFGYVVLSGVSRSLRGRPPNDAEAVVVAVATQAPDLVDKPLSWTLGVVTTGYGPAHSVFVGVPAVVLLAGAARVRNKAVSVAVLVGYASHLVGDVLRAREFVFGVGRLLWPLVSWPPYEHDLSFVERVGRYVGIFLVRMTSPENVALVLGYASIFALGGILWMLDGTPGVRWVRRLADRASS
ncbi:putative membrane-bound metal-dependent hydrolase [Haloferax mucosum ATCC BAA-1512]|uniref:Putative membrane-bound metal-dependent hydrolase n=1 Tax=Haloferax mucosum ATCC BAA-1512 TaxID=662479 RepID=M0IN06_9EURY|nr:metal-dependent hydrolase [Haloferax mucosum]ELZ98100.1 putative membrane-bound metal-dependent hydrolase [Haloferax mucosum ATCC BAA-1512]